MKYLFCSGFRNKLLTSNYLNMALTAEEKMLISIIESNQRRIEELLLSRSQSYQMKNLPLQRSATESKVPNTCKIDSAVQNFVDLDGLIPKILGPAYNEPSVAPNEQTSQNYHKNDDNDQPSCQDELENGLNVIVDHCIPLPESSPQCLKEKEVIPKVDGVPISDNVILNTALNIPGLGQDNASSEQPIVSKDLINLKCLSMSNRAKNKSNVWIIKKDGTRRKKAMSSETDSQTNRLSNGSLPPPKRRRFSSSSFVFDSDSINHSQGTTKLSSSPSLATNTSCELKIQLKTFNENKSELLTSANDRKLEGSLKPPLLSDIVVSTKKKTKILSSPLKRMQQSSPKLKLKSTPTESSSSSNSLEPYIACWAHCPAILTGVPSAHCVPKRMFINHLREYHTPPTPINLRNQQIVCICHACETVVPYSYQSKRDHLNQRCTKWHQQFFLFIENAQDSFAIPRFNAPVVKSPGLAGMFKSIAHHPDLDTLTWKNVKNEHFCYHFCGFCNQFVEDSMRAVSDHKATAIHRVNVRKSTN